MRVRAYERDLDLPPNGYCGWTADGSIDVKSQDFEGHRADYAATPAYLYIDGRHHFVRTARAAGNGIGICRILPDGYEVLLHDRADCGFAISAGTATATGGRRPRARPCTSSQGTWADLRGAGRGGFQLLADEEPETD